MVATGGTGTSQAEKAKCDALAIVYATTQIFRAVLSEMKSAIFASSAWNIVATA